MICLPLSALVAAMVSLLTSVHSFATVVWACGVLPLVALLMASLRARGGRTRGASHEPSHWVEAG